MTPEAIQTPVKPSMECFDGIIESCKWWSKTNNANDQPRIDIEIKCENSWTLQLIPETDVSLVMDWVSRAPSCFVTLLRIVVKFVKRSYMWIGMTIIDMIKSVRITEMRNWNGKGDTKWGNKEKEQLNSSIQCGDWRIFPAFQILREIKFRALEIKKLSFFAILETENLSYWKLPKLFKIQ